jgi:hypothetical protein
MNRCEEGASDRIGEENVALKKNRVIKQTTGY